MMGRSTSWVNAVPSTLSRRQMIDFLRFSEAINQQTTNQMALHTLPGCYHSTTLDQKGTDADLDCSTPAGCVVRESTPNSFGTGFNSMGGGVWATQFDVSGVLCVPPFLRS